MSTQNKDENESLLSRWSRRKEEARVPPPREAPKPADAGPPPELPPVGTLGFDSDFSGFMDKRVDDAVRRIALKKMFSDPRFNIRDGLDDYAENYAALEDLPAAMVDQLQHARRTLRGPEPEQRETAETQAAGPRPEEQVEEQVERQVEQQAERQLTESSQEAQPLAQGGSAQAESAAPKDAGETNERTG